MFSQAPSKKRETKFNLLLEFQRRGETNLHENEKLKEREELTFSAKKKF